MFILTGCATLGTQITRDNNQISMPHYSFVIPADEGWHLKITGGQLEVALITNATDAGR